MAQNSDIDLKGTVRKNLNTVSNLALYLNFPGYLNPHTVNFFNEKLGKEKLPENYLVTAQLRQKNASSFTVRVPQVVEV